MYDIYLKTMLYEACMKYAFLIKEKTQGYFKIFTDTW